MGEGVSINISRGSRRIDDSVLDTGRNARHVNAIIRDAIPACLGARAETSMPASRGDATTKRYPLHPTKNKKNKKKKYKRRKNNGGSCDTGRWFSSTAA